MWLKNIILSYILISPVFQFQLVKIKVFIYLFSSSKCFTF